MIPEAFLAAVLAASAKARPAPEAPRAAMPAQVYYGEELETPFLPVLPPAAAAAAAPRGWLAAPASLVLLGSDGALVHELGLGRYSNEDGSTRRDLRGGAAKNGRFAWHWQSVTAGERTSSVLVYLGAHGQILKRLDAVEAPEGLPPAALSADGEVLVAARRQEGSWTVTALAFTGRELAAVTKAHRVTAFAVSENGRRALVAWAGLDLPEIVTLLDLRGGERLDLPADGLPAGPWTLAPDGTLLAAGRPVRRLP